MKKVLIITNVLFALTAVFGMNLNDDNVPQNGNYGSKKAFNTENCVESEQDQLMQAVGNNNLKEVERIVKRYINKSAICDLVMEHKNYQTNNKNMPNDVFLSLHNRIFNPNVSVFINFSNKQGVTPVFMATCKNNLEIVRYLVELGANVNGAITDSLIIMSKEGILYSAEQETFLCNSKLMGSMCITRKGTTPLHMAVSFGYDALVKYLVENGANVNAKDADGKSPLCCAFMHESKELAKYLIEHGSNVNEKIRGIYPLFHATLQNDESLVRRLIEHGASVDIEVDGYTPLFFALKQGYRSLIDLFIEQGAEVRGVEGQLTSLIWAVMHNCGEKVCNYLIKHGDDVNANIRGYTPLFIAFKYEDENLIRLLIENGASVNVENNGGETPLFCAVRSENTSLILFLLEHGAIDVMKENFWGDCPLLLAQENAQYEQDPRKKAEWRKIVNIMKEIIKDQQ